MGHREYRRRDADYRRSGSLSHGSGSAARFEVSNGWFKARSLGSAWVYRILNIKSSQENIYIEILQRRMKMIIF